MHRGEDDRGSGQRCQAESGFKTDLWDEAKNTEILRWAAEQGAWPAGVDLDGMEKSFTRRALRRLVESAGFRVTAETGILFMPGWLRMFDLWCHTRVPALTAVSGRLIRPFAWAYRRVPAVRRHGYLIACVVERPV